MEAGVVALGRQPMNRADRTSGQSRAASRINDRIDALRDEIIAALRSVIRIPSITPHYPGEDYDSVVGGEGDVARALGALYKRAGCEVDVFGMEAGRENCVGLLRGAGKGRSLIYNGHSDVVPPGPADEWGPGGPWS